MNVALTVLGIVVACAIPVAALSAVSVWAGRAAERFFTALSRTSDALVPQKPSVPFGLGMEDMSVSTVDYFPGRRAVFRPTTDPEVERLRERAATGTRLYYAMAPVSLVAAALISLALGAFPLIPIGVTWMAWAFLQFPAFRHHLWASRPEVRDNQSLAVNAYALVALVVVVTLAAALGLVWIILLLHG